MQIGLQLVVARHFVTLAASHRLLTNCSHAFEPYGSRRGLEQYAFVLECATWDCFGRRETVSIPVGATIFSWAYGRRLPTSDDAGRRFYRLGRALGIASSAPAGTSGARSSSANPSFAGIRIARSFS